MPNKRMHSDSQKRRRLDCPYPPPMGQLERVMNGQPNMAAALRLVG